MVRHRRRFFTTASGAIAAVAAASITDAPNVIAPPKVQWRMSTTWTPALDVLQGAAQRLAEVVDDISGWRFRIEVFPGGQIMQPFECFDATSKGTIEAFMARALLLLPGVARTRHHARVRLQQGGVRGASGRSATDARPCRGGRPGLWHHGFPRE